LVAAFVAPGFEAAWAQEEIVLKAWFGRENFIPGDRFAAFERENPGVKVVADVIPLEQSVAEYIRAAQAGQQPDVVQVPADSIGPLARQGMLKDVGELFASWKADEPETYNNLVDLAWTMGSFEGVQYGVALHMGPFWYVFRKDLFEQANIPYPPATWDDVLDAGMKLKGPNMTGFAIIGSRAHDPVWMLSIFMSMGGQFIENVPQLDSPAGVYLLKFYQELMKNGIAHSETLAWDSGNMRAAFIGGNAAQALIGDNIFPTIQESMEYGSVWSGSAPPSRPGAEAENRYMALGWPYLVSEQTQHPELVLKLLQYMSRTEIVKEVALRYQPTTNIAVLNDPEYVVAKPWAPSFAEPFSKLVPLPAHAKQPEIYQVLLDAMQEALSNPDANPEELAKTYQSDINKIVQ